MICLKYNGTRDLRQNLIGLKFSSALKLLTHMGLEFFLGWTKRDVGCFKGSLNKSC